LSRSGALRKGMTALLQSILYGMGALSAAVAVCFFTLSLLFYVAESLRGCDPRSSRRPISGAVAFALPPASSSSPSTYVAGTSVLLMWLPLSSCSLGLLVVILALSVVPSSSESNTIHLLRLLRRGETSDLA
jgi:hypothetical protein